MAFERPAGGSVAALLVALALGVVLALTQRSEGPSRAEVAQALAGAGGEDVKTADLRDLGCALTSGGYACRWRQRMSGDWRERTGVLRIDRNGWRMVEDEAR